MRISFELSDSDLEHFKQIMTRARSSAEGKDLKTIYREVYDFMKPRYSDWVIFDHCMPFDVSRAYDEASGHVHPRIWTDKRDLEMWAQLEG